MARKTKRAKRIGKLRAKAEELSHRQSKAAASDAAKEATKAAEAAWEAEAAIVEVRKRLDALARKWGGKTGFAAGPEE